MIPVKMENIPKAMQNILLQLGEREVSRCRTTQVKPVLRLPSVRAQWEAAAKFSEKTDGGELKVTILLTF